MKKEDCFQLLGLSESSSEVEIKKKYTELFNDYQLRLTNAPTPNLKRLYQKNLQELNEALEVLLDGGSEGITKDLPSSTPVYDKQNREEKPEFVSKQAHSGTLSKNKGSEARLEAGLNKYKKLFRLMMITSILALAGITIVLIQLSEKNSAIKELQQSAAKVEPLSKEVELLKQELLPFQNGKMKIKNYGTDNLKLTWLIVMYKDNDGNLVKYEDYFDKIIRPGSTEEINKLSGATYVWDGSVISYACGLEYKGAKFIQSGLWSGDSENGNLILNLGTL